MMKRLIYNFDVLDESNISDVRGLFLSVYKMRNTDWISDSNAEVLPHIIMPLQWHRSISAPIVVLDQL